ncbi:MAG: T9SS type A sorting domain-containing protein [Chitinophagaceae bacterium]|nr:T9SS type A sorting domain-containing protein [Chitinophagaceae bacterium]
MKLITKVLIAIAAIFTTSIGNAQTPTAHNVFMTPIVQASPIIPFDVTLANSAISSYTIETTPDASEGVLSININALVIPVSTGMMITPDLVYNLAFTPNPTFTGEVVFTYSATDESSNVSNVAKYTIPVVAQQPVILPISLLNFTGSEAGKKVQLYWQTSNEINSSYFELQKSTDGNNFETFATTTAKGNTTINNYQGTDDLFFYHYKTIYYRLKMVDINGTYKYSTIVMITLDVAVKNSIKAWPLPFTNNLNIAYTSDTDETVKISIHSINGAAVTTISSNVKKGNNVINLNQAQSILPGTYLLTISNSTKAQTIKVIKQ